MKLSVLMAIVSTAQAVNINDKSKGEIKQKSQDAAKF